MMFVLCPYCHDAEVQVTGEGQFAISHPDNGSEFGWSLTAMCYDCDQEFEVRLENTHLLGGIRRVSLVSVAIF